MANTEITWNNVHPDHRERLQEQGLPLKDAAACFPWGGDVLPSLVDAVQKLERATSDRDAANEQRTLRMRQAYRGGTTAAHLSEVAGISVARVNQIVAGARRERT